LTVPALHEMSRLESTAPASQSSARRRGPSWSKRQAWIFLGAVIAVTAAGLLAYLEITRPRIGAVESLAPIQVWSVWQDLRRGPDRHLTPPEKQFLDHLHMYRIWRMVFVVGVGIGILLMIASYAIPAPRTSHQLYSGTTSIIATALLAGVTSAHGAAELPTHKLHTSQVKPASAGVCPPFHLRDKDGNVINPVKGENSDRPYSPKMTCGGCHDYEKIARGYHFTQGLGERPTADQAARCVWASTPGNFGGNWCSPAPLYRYLSPKENKSPATMDMTAFDFFTSSCGQCHPGGGSAEFDRLGKRYDRWMSDPASGFSAGAENNLDGDYHKARWGETGVLEADCLLCHMPGYDNSQRTKQLAAWNLQWAATAGAKLATITGSMKDGKPVQVVYNATCFNPDGTLNAHIIR
jgi:hypothetical protein